MTALTDSQLERYARHVILDEVGEAGQEKLLASSVLVLGAGGLGSPMLLYLAAAGVGRIGVVDDDAVELSNLQRQIIHGTASLGRSKVASAKETMAAINPEIVVEAHAQRLTVANAAALVAGYDLIADGSDNFATRYLLNDACYLARKPLVSAALLRFDAQLSVFKAYLGPPHPCYRCLFPEPPPAGTVPACAEAGILGALTGVIGSLVALEVIREIVGFGEGLVGRLLMIDARAMRFETLSYGWDPANPLSGEKPTIINLSAHR